MKHSMARKKKKRAHRLYILLSLVIIIILSTTFMIFNKRESGKNVKKDARIQKEIEIQASEKKETIPQASPSPPLLKEVNYTIKKGTTFADILSGHQITLSEIHKMREVAKTSYDLAKINAGHELRIFSTNNGNVQRIEYDIDETDYLLLEKVKEKDEYNAEIKKIPYKIELRVISGTLEDNLIAAVNTQEEEAALALSLSDIFAWDIDFYTDPRTGDKFKIMFEKRSLKDKFVGYGKIIAAEYINQEQKFQAFHYTYSDTKEGDHFDAEGNSLRKEFLKSPIPFSRIRITSGFSYRRFHPIRKVYRPHYGVDYAARVGTQIQATADGTVTFAGWNKASGYTIKIRHKNSYETMYLHLHSSRRAAGIRKGAKVKQGQTIGYVGSSGEATGPHLDYRIKYRGSYINPLAKKFRPVSPLRKEFIEDYKGKVALYSIFLENPLALVTWFSNFFTLPPPLLESFLD